MNPYGSKKGSKKSRPDKRLAYFQDGIHAQKARTTDMKDIALAHIKARWCRNWAERLSLSAACAICVAGDRTLATTQQQTKAILRVS
jgi:hypothetical protein